MNILEHLDKNNFHHAYLIEGARDEIVSEILEFLKNLGIETTGNADVSHISLDSFKIDDARNLKSYAGEKGFSLGHSATGEASEKKIFIISTNSFLLEAQNSLLKMFEEPVENTHFFLIIPDASALLKTFISRFYFIPTKSDLTEKIKNAEQFINMSLQKRIDFIKELLMEEEIEKEIISTDSTRAKSLKFLNNLEFVLHKKLISRSILDISFIPSFYQIFKVREYLRQPGSSTKTLMESVALVVPVLQ